MSSDLRDLYQEIIVDHSKRPRNFRRLEHGRSVEGFNPLCGDRITVFLDTSNDHVDDVAFQGNGCAISTASASVMTEAVKGKTTEEVHALFAKFHRLVTQGEGGDDPDLGKLAVFAGVSEFPSRVKCATLPWHTLEAVVKGDVEKVSTE